MEGYMNTPVLIAGILSLLAFFVHALIGDKELQALKPSPEASNKSKETWVQARSGWHWVSVDLFLSGVVLLILTLSEIIKAKNEILLLLGIYFTACGIAWLFTVFFSKNHNKQIIILGQWIFCFLMSALIFWGRSQLI